ncbi:hypothetical protein DBR17_13265 [Sphingomonas sp. HMWF008]|nr:hypothetical protein DBR17_13265 [Sphingomonas sp. HMWF008]
MIDQVGGLLPHSASLRLATLIGSSCPRPGRSAVITSLYAEKNAEPDGAKIGAAVGIVLKGAQRVWSLSISVAGWYV